MVLGIDERINGVNLGNWLVLEKWMDPEPFVRTAEDDEIWMHRTHGALWSERNLAEELRRHRDAYITLDSISCAFPYHISSSAIGPDIRAASHTSTARSVGRGRRD